MRPFVCLLQSLHCNLPLTLLEDGASAIPACVDITCNVHQEPDVCFLPCDNWELLNPSGGTPEHSWSCSHGVSPCVSALVLGCPHRALAALASGASRAPSAQGHGTGAEHSAVAGASLPSAASLALPL